MSQPRSLWLAGLVMVLCGWVGGAEFWVDGKNEKASDEGPGTAERPWRTIGKATQMLAAGDTVIVRPGVYRERILPKNSGEAGKPITYRAEGPGVALSGAEALTGWKRCTAETAAVNPHHANIWYVDMTWEPPSLFEDGKPLVKAREPNKGWWIAEGGGTHTLMDAKNLTQPEGHWVGSTVFFWDVDVTSQGWRKVTAFDAKSHTLTLATPIYRDRVVEPGKDRYFIENKLALLDRPGEWVVEGGEKRYRVYLWPTASDDPSAHLVEAPARERFVFEYDSRSHLRIVGFEVRHGASHGIGAYAGTPQDIEIVNCYVHHNLGHGLYLMSTKGVTARGNLVTENQYGVSCGRVTDATIERNEVGDNDFDGLVVSHQSANVAIRGNYIHGHNLWGHPDNVQFHNGLSNVTVEGNVLLDGGQAIMMEACDQGVIRNNLVIGSVAVALIFGHGNTNNFRVSNNTVAFTGYGAMSFTGKGYEVWNNVLYPGTHSATFGVVDAASFKSDYNLLFRAAGLQGPFVGYAKKFPGTFADYQKAAEQDAHSRSADPQFVSAPVCCAQIDERRLFDCTASKLFLRGSAAIFAVGDHVEVKFDRVARKVKEAGSDYIVVEPALKEPLEKGGLALNWKDKAEFALDLRLKSGSPGRGAGKDGADMGAALDLQAFARGDVDGDGKTDIRRRP